MALNGRASPDTSVDRRPFASHEADEDEGRFGPAWATGDAAKPKLPPLRWHRDADPNAERAWLVKDLIPEAGKGLLSGQWGAGKTFGVLDLSASIMTGQPFAGRKVMRRGGILFVAPEGAFEIPIRLRGLVAGKLADDDAIDPADLPFAWVEECPRLVDAGAADMLAEIAGQAAAELRGRYDLPLAAIVIDTVAAGAGFNDENSAAEAQAVMSGLERLSQKTGAFVLGVDHFGKASETGTRGSSAKEAAADVVLAMLATRDEAGNVSNTRMAVRKLRGGRIGQETPYSLDPIEIGQDRWGDPITTCIVNWQTDRTSKAAAEAAKSRWPTSLRVFRTALTTALAEHGVKVRPFGFDGPEVLAVQQAHVREEFGASYPVDGDTQAQRSEARKKAFQRAVRKAQADRLIAARDLSGVDHYWLTEGVPHAAHA